MYELIQAGENSFYINCPAKIGVYRLPGDKVVLIDSGSDKDAGKKVLNILAANSWEVSAIINTHSHADHAGGNRIIAERTGCQIYSTKMERVFCEFPVLEPAFLYGGFPCKPLRNKFLMADASQVQDICEYTLPEGMEIIPLKGHFFEMIGIKTEDDVYFMADCIVDGSILEKYHISFIYDVSEYLKTLDMVETLRGRIFIPSHAEAGGSMKEMVKTNRNKVLEIMGKIKCICKEPLSFEDILKGLFDEYCLKMDFNQYVLAGSTVRSYLSYMLDRQMIRADCTDNRLLWTAF